MVQRCLTPFTAKWVQTHCYFYNCVYTTTQMFVKFKHCIYMLFQEVPVDRVKHIKKHRSMGPEMNWTNIGVAVNFVFNNTLKFI